MAEAQLVEMVEDISGQMCINTEWGCFGDDGALSDILTPYDKHVDQESSNPGKKRCTPPTPAVKAGSLRPLCPSSSMSGPTSGTIYFPEVLLGALKGLWGARGDG